MITHAYWDFQLNSWSLMVILMGFQSMKLWVEFSIWFCHSKIIIEVFKENLWNLSSLWDLWELWVFQAIYEIMRFMKSKDDFNYDDDYVYEVYEVWKSRSHTNYYGCWFPTIGSFVINLVKTYSNVWS